MADSPDSRGRPFSGRMSRSLWQAWKGPRRVLWAGWCPARSFGHPHERWSRGKLWRACSAAQYAKQLCLRGLRGDILQRLWAGFQAALINRLAVRETPENVALTAGKQGLHATRGLSLTDAYPCGEQKQEEWLPAPHPWQAASLAEAIFQRKKLGVQFGEGLPQFCQFFFGQLGGVRLFSMLHPEEVPHSQDVPRPPSAST